jgi:hypothetical protein
MDGSCGRRNNPRPGGEGVMPRGSTGGRRLKPPAFAADGWTQSLGPAHRHSMRPPTDNKIGGANDQEKQVQKEIPNWFSPILFFSLNFSFNRPPSLYYSTDPKNWRYPSSLSSGSAGESVNAPHSYGPHRLLHLSICDRAICVCSFSFLSSFVFLLLL